MIKGKQREKELLSKELVLSKVDDYNIIRYYLGQDFNFKKKYSSPFRKDNTPNLCFFVGDNGSIFFKDFATGRSGDCFQFVQYLHNLNFYEALMRVDEDMGLGLQSHKPVLKVQLSKKPDSIPKQSKVIQIVPKEFDQRDLDYWDSYHITKEELAKKNVYSIDKLYINKRLIPNIGNELRFAYLFDNYLKIYTPFSKTIKWVSSCPNDFISGFDEIKYKVFRGTQSDKLIISKSVKDEIILSKFFPDVCSTQNESSAAINNENMQYILKGYKPENVYIAYDNDKAGVDASTYFTKNYGFNYVNVPKVFIREGIKDWADFAKYKDLETVGNYLKIKNLI